MSFSSSEIAQLSKVIEENPRTWSPRRVLVTGGHGLVGSHLTRLLVKIGVEVNVLGRKHQMIDIGGNELLESRITYFNGPIWDKKLILKALEGCAVVFHAPYTDEECTNSVILKKELVLSTSLLIQACKETQVTRIVFVSSSKVVLDTSLTDGQFSFEALKYPKKFVSEASKALAEAERLVLNASLDYDMGILACSLRPHNIYDADSGFTKRTREGVNDFFSSFFLGKGSNLSDFTHASNVAIACVLAANKLSTFHANGRAYYISDQEIVPFWDFITLIREKYGWNYPYFGIMDTLSVWIGYISSWICFPRLVNYFSLEYSILATRSFYSQSTSAFEDFGYTPSIKTFKALSEINYSKSRHWNRSRGSIFEQTFFQVVFYFLLASAVTSFLTFSHYLGVDKAVTILSYVLISLVCGPLLTYISYIIFAFMEAPSDDSFENLDKRDLEMKVFFVTGGNRGIGFETAKILANLGGHVIIGCRDQKQGQMAIDRIKSESNCSGKVECIQLDLSSLVSVSNCVSAIQKRKILISHLINNAGAMTSPDLSIDCIDLQFQTNHLGHFALTSGLLKKKCLASNSRIINVSSCMHWFGSTNIKSILTCGKFGKIKQYCSTKLLNILFSKELDRRISHTGKRSLAVHPGIVATDFILHFIPKWLAKTINPVLSKFQISPGDSAKAIVFACLSNKLEGVGGAYLSLTRIATPAPATRSAVLAQELWEISENLIQERFKN